MNEYEYFAPSIGSPNGIDAFDVASENTRKSDNELCERIAVKMIWEKSIGKTIVSGVLFCGGLSPAVHAENPLQTNATENRNLKKCGRFYHRSDDNAFLRGFQEEERNEKEKNNGGWRRHITNPAQIRDNSALIHHFVFTATFDSNASATPGLNTI